MLNASPSQTALSRQTRGIERVLNIIGRGTYNRTCPFPSIRLKQALAGPVAWRRTIRPLRSVSSAGPFTATIVAASNLSVGSGVIVTFAVWLT